jgi:hypothetical protein
LLIGTTSSVASFPDDDDESSSSSSSSPLFLSDDDFDDANNDTSVFLLRFRLDSPPEIISLISNCLLLFLLFPILNVFSLWCTRRRRSEEAKRPSRRLLRDEEDNKEDKEEVRRISRTTGGFGDIFCRRLLCALFLYLKNLSEEVKKFEDDVFRLI